MKDFRGKVVVVTGAGSGIGRALAQDFAKRGAKLAIQDWNKDSVQETAATLGESPVLVDHFDVADREAMYAFKDNVLAEYGQVDVMINNAGVAVAQTIEDVSYEDFEWVMGVNFWGMVYGTKAFLPALKQRPEASIANVSSVFGLFSVPTQGTYNASKFAIRGVNEALWHELQDTNVSALSIHPGGIRTNIAKAARFHVGPSGEDHQTGAKNFQKLARTTPEKAAAIIIKAIQKKQRRVLVGPDAVGMDKLVRALPTGYWAVMKRMMPGVK